MPEKNNKKKFYKKRKSGIKLSKETTTRQYISKYQKTKRNITRQFTRKY